MHQQPSVEEIAVTNNQKEASAEDESDDGGLQFFDPAAEKKAQQAAAKQEAIRNQLKNMPQGMNSASFQAVASLAAAPQKTDRRQAMLQSLKSQMLQKKSRNLTLDKLKSTFRK